VYVQDFKMAGNRLLSLFDYLRRVGSSLVLTQLVFDEVSAKYSDRLNNAARKLDDAAETVAKLCFSSRKDHPRPDFAGELKTLQHRLKAPSEKVNTVFLDNYSEISLADVMRRGIQRIRPANSEGEELRDVTIWLWAMRYAKETKSDLAFIS